MASASNGGVTASYTYNALGQRIKRTASSVTTLYAYDEAGHLAGEYTAAGALIQETVWLGDTPVATLRPNGSGGVIVYYVHADHLNTPRLVTDLSNNIRWRWDSDPFGTTTPNENPASLGVFVYNLRFPGQQYDPIVGLHYNYSRDYDPAVGGYIENDPIDVRGKVLLRRAGLSPSSYLVGQTSETHITTAGSSPALSITPFGYASQNPIQRFDAYGLLDEGGKPGGGGPGVPGYQCPLVGQILMYQWWPWYMPSPSRLLMCIYDCNTSCPGSYDRIKIRFQMVVNPPYKCPPFYSMRLGD